MPTGIINVYSYLVYLDISSLNYIRTYVFSFGTSPKVEKISIKNIAKVFVLIYANIFTIGRTSNPHVIPLTFAFDIA